MDYLVFVADGRRHRVVWSSDLGDDPAAALRRQQAAGGVSMLVRDSGETLHLDWDRIASWEVRPDDQWPEDGPPREHFGDLPD